MLPENETITFEDQLYVNPETSLQEQNAFINNLRNIQNQNTAEIATDTYNLGTSVPSNLGGLGGGGSYFEARYSTPQGVALANNLRATAQAQALNDILSNEQAMMKQRYANAQRAARQRARVRYSGGGGGGTTLPTTNTGEGNVTVTPSDDDSKVTYGGSVTAYPGTQVVISKDGIAHVVDSATGEVIDIKPPASTTDTGSSGTGWSGGGANRNMGISGR